MKAIAAACLAALSSTAVFAQDAVYEARGQEPGWLLRIEGQSAALTLQDGRKFQTTLPEAQRMRKGRRYQVRLDGKPAGIVIDRRICRDTMSGMPHPDRVSIAGLGAPLRGCGGSPRSLLGSAEWRVVQIGGKAVLRGSKPSVQFLEDNAVAGNGSCNRFRASYALSGEGLAIKAPASTMMACEPEKMKQEQALLRQLEATTGFDIRPDGSLVLKAGDGSSLVARRSR